MNRSETLGNLAKALAIVQSKLQPAIKDAKNPFFKSNYSSLNSVWDACRELLTKNGLSVAQLNQIAPDGVIIETVLMHESGEWISGEMFLPLTKHDAQGVGSATSYGRRYGLAAIVGIVTDEDDDGSGASRPPQHKQPDEPSLNDRIVKAGQEIRKLGGTVDKRGENETEQAYLESLTEQYKTLKAKQH